MIHVTLPSNLQILTDGISEFDLEASSVKALIRELDQRYPGIAEALQSGFAIAINGEVINNPKYELIPERANVYFLAALQGG
jgi:molybdopterin converting factor small subunit